MLEANPRPGERADTFDRSVRPRVAWKTGTSYGFCDAWALGGTRRHTVAVWVARPDGTPLPGQYGAVPALPLMFEVLYSLPLSRRAHLQRPPLPTVVQQDIGRPFANGCA